MHYQGFVVSLRDARTKKPYREFEHHRDGNDSRARLTVPFDSEYEFQFKSMDGWRRRLEITIDGTPIGTGALVVPGFGVCPLERFLDSDKRFKFVPLSNDGVADPSSNENGIIVVKAWRERQPIKTVFTASCLRSAGDTTRHVYHSGASLSGDGASVMGWGSADSGGTIGAANLSASNAMAGATVEGGKSDQHIGTTDWLGDEDLVPMTFTFKLVGAPAEPKTGFCTECGGKLRKADKFCSSCGTKVHALV